MKVELTGTIQECQALAFLIDAAVKSLGIRGAGDACNWIAKIEAGIKAAQTEGGQNGKMETN
jgi:hypothetical protein